MKECTPIFRIASFALSPNVTPNKATHFVAVLVSKGIVIARGQAAPQNPKESFAEMKAKLSHKIPTIPGRFVSLIDRVIDIAQQRITRRSHGVADSAPPGALEYIVDALSRYRREALSGKLPPSDGVATIGILREVADWGEGSDSSLFKAAKELERYYLEKNEISFSSF